MALRPLITCLLLTSLLGGCTDDGDAALDDAVEEAPDQPKPDVASFMGDGTLALGNCWDGPLGTSCVFNVGDPTSSRLAGNIVHFPIEGANGTIASATVTLTWTPSSPLTEELELRFTALECGSSCSTHHVEAVTQGTSPLTLDLPATTLEAGLVLGVTVARSDLGNGNRASLLQDFSIEGSAEL